MRVALLAFLALAGCSTYNETNYFSVDSTFVLVADSFVGMHEKTDREELKIFLEVDPLRTEWCAAFVNAVLGVSGEQGTDSLLARSFLDWGVSVDSPEKGDVVIFPRGRSSWQGHVGFFVEEFERDGIRYYVILGGNQENKVSYDVFRADKALGIRRAI